MCRNRWRSSFGIALTNVKLLSWEIEVLDSVLSSMGRCSIQYLSLTKEGISAINVLDRTFSQLSLEVVPLWRGVNL